MEFINLKTQDQDIRQKILKNIQKVVNSGQFILSRQLAAFEQEIAQYLGVKYAIGVASGTDALLLSLMALDIKKDDEVITTPFTFIATVSAIARLGAKPIFADIDKQTFNIGANQIERYITPKTKAIIPVHLYGQMAQMPQISAIAKRHRLVVIEDACQALGSRYQDKKAGAFGNLACFSFFPSKNLGAYGDSGLVATNNKKLAEKIKALRTHGSENNDKYYHRFFGLNSRLDEIQAAILRIKLKRLDQWNQKRIEIAENYNQSLGQIVTVPYYDQFNYHIYHQYTIRTRFRDALKDYLEKNKIATNIYYPLPLHLQPACQYLGYQKGDFPEAENAAKQVLSLPIYPELNAHEQKYIIQKIKTFFQKNN